MHYTDFKSINLDACRMYGVVPVSYFIRNMEQETLQLGLGSQYYYSNDTVYIPSTGSAARVFACDAYFGIAVAYEVSY